MERKKSNFDFENNFKKLITNIYGTQKILSMIKKSNLPKEESYVISLIDDIATLLDNVTYEIDEEYIRYLSNNEI